MRTPARSCSDDNPPTSGKPSTCNLRHLLTTPQHILRLLNTNVKGGGKIMFALTEIKGVGRRYSNLVCKKADIDLNKRLVERRSRPKTGRI